ncbi:MAG: VOC family protein [Dehalococcoidales bacterium]|nr:MAG: VOC family protein [Dehalococcoidales bacterium]
MTVKNSRKTTTMQINGEAITGGMPFSKIDHIGVVVSELDKAVGYYQALGIGPFKRVDAVAVDRMEYGKPVDFVMRIRVAKIGDLWFELIQPVSGESFHERFLKSRGEGISHLAFSVDDIDQWVTKLADMGINAIVTGKFEGGGGFAYYDIGKASGVMFELIQWSPGGP